MNEAYNKIKTLYPNFKPLLGIVLGSGLGGFTSHLEDVVYIDYNELPGFPIPTVYGHSGRLALGKLANVPLICLEGRAHLYEGQESLSSVKTYVRTLKLLGCEYFLATNAAGSLRENAAPGDLMLITDHINLQPLNPLIGSNDDTFGPRFYPLDNAYDLNLRSKLLKTAGNLNLTLHTGVYMCVTGPHYETAAEIKAFKILGADAVGMSTVPEVLVANHCGMKVAVISAITNYATGLNVTAHSHEDVVKTAASASEKLIVLIRSFIEDLTHE